MLRTISITIFCLFTVISLQAQDLTNNPLVQSQNIIQTQEDVTVTIDQTYGDTKQIAVWFTIDGLELPEGQLVGAPFIHIEPRIADQPPTAIGSMGSDIEFLENGSIEGYYDFDLEFEAPHVLELAFEVRIYQIDDMPLWNMPDDYVVSSQTPDDQFLYELPYDLTFMLPATVSLNQPKILEVDYAEQSNDLMLTIDDITLTPISAHIPICFDMPSSEDWQPNVALSINENEAYMDGYHLETQNPSQSPRCVTVRFKFSIISNPDTMTITVNGLQGSIPEQITQERILEAQNHLTELGIFGTYDNLERGINFVVVSKPDNMTEGDANLAMFNALRDRWQGSWSLIIELN